MPTAIAVTASDIHLSHTCPLARTAEGDWYEVMKRQLQELGDLAEKYDAPLLYAGDIFHTYNPPPCLINFAIKHLPKGIAIPGQHDLPHHVYKDMHKTAYGCLVSAGVLWDAVYGDPIHLGFVSPKGVSRNGVIVHGFPWGFDFHENPCPVEKSSHIALVHRYVWQKDSGYKGASVDHLLKNIRKICNTYEFVVFGDNHKGFQAGNVVNNGTFMRRHIDEKDQQPCVSVLWSDGSIERIPLQSTAADVFSDTQTVSMEPHNDFDLSGFMDELRELSAGSVDFVEALRRYCDSQGVDDNVRTVLMEATGAG